MVHRRHTATSSFRLTPLAVARRKRGLSLLELGNEINYDKGNLSKIERGMMRPGPDVVIRLFDYFNGELTRDEIMFPEYHQEQKKPSRSTKLLEAH